MTRLIKQAKQVVAGGVVAFQECGWPSAMTNSGWRRQLLWPSKFTGYAVTFWKRTAVRAAGCAVVLLVLPTPLGAAARASSTLGLEVLIIHNNLRLPRAGAPVTSQFHFTFFA